MDGFKLPLWPCSSFSMQIHANYHPNTRKTSQKRVRMHRTERDNAEHNKNVAYIPSDKHGAAGARGKKQANGRRVDESAASEEGVRKHTDNSPLRADGRARAQGGTVLRCFFFWGGEGSALQLTQSETKRVVPGEWRENRYHPGQWRAGAGDCAAVCVDVFPSKG